MTSGLSHETRHEIYKYFRKLVLALNKGPLHILWGWIWGWSGEREDGRDGGAAAEGTVPQTQPDRGFRPAIFVTNAEHFPLSPAYSHLPLDQP